MRRKFGNWMPMEYENVEHVAGLTWWKVKGGFGGHGDQESWVADVPGAGISVSRWLEETISPGNGHDELLLWDRKHENKYDAMRAAVRDGLDRQEYRVRQELDKLATVHAGLRRLEEAVRNLGDA